MEKSSGKIKSVIRPNPAERICLRSSTGFEGGSPSIADELEETVVTVTTNGVGAPAVTFGAAGLIEQVAGAGAPVQLSLTTPA
jgi:hypothetical protein